MKELSQRNILQIIILIEIVAMALGQTITCGNGCIQCDNNLKCLKCDLGYELDSVNNNCIYNNCQEGLFFQKIINQASSSSVSNQQNASGICQAICDDEFYQSKSQNICVKFDQCSLSYQSQQDINRGDQILDLIPYNQDYFIVVFAHYINQIVRANGQYEQTLDLSEDIVKIIGIDQLVYILQNDMTLYRWDISYNKKIFLTSINQNAQDVSNAFLTIVQNSILCSITQLKTKNYLAIQHLLTISNQVIPPNIIEIQLAFNPLEQIYIMNQFILYVNLNSVRIDEVAVNNNQQMNISYFTTQKYICSNFPTQSIQAIKKSLSGKYISVIFQQSKQLLSITADSCFSYQFDQTASQLEFIQIMGQDYLIIQLESSFQVFNIVSQKKEADLNFSPLQIIDMKLSLVNSGDAYTLFILLNNQNANSYNILLKNNIIQINEINKAQIIITNPNKIFLLPQIASTNINERLFIGGADLQSYLTPQQNQNIEKKEYITMNYSLDYDIIPSAIISSVILTEQKTIIVCTNDGSIYSWDNGHIYQEIYQNYIQIPNTSCLKIKSFNSINQYDILVLFDNQFIILDSFSFQIKLQVPFVEKPQAITPLITEYLKQTIILFDQNLYYISQDDYILKQLIFNNYSSEIMKIQLQQNNFLIIQKNLTLEIFSINLNTMTASLQDTYTSAGPIQIWKSKQFPFPQYSYYFEVYVYSQDNTFVFLQKTASSFSPVQTVTGVPISQGVDITFIKDDLTDPAFFVIGRTNKKAATLPYECYAIQRNKSNFILFFSVSSALALTEPVTFLDANSSTIYDVKVVQSLSFMSTIGTMTFDISAGTNFLDEVTILPGIYGSRQLSTQDKKFTYVYDQNGFLGINIFKRKFYTQLYNVLGTDLAAGDQITDVQMSYVINRYFIIRRDIFVYNINDNTQDQSITFQEANSLDPVKTFLILENEQVVIACKKNIIKLMNYLTNKISTFNDSTLTISNIVITPIGAQNMITIFGNRILRLNLTLVNQDNTSISFDPNVATSCLFPTNSIICKLSTNNVVILDSAKFTITTQFQSRNLATSFLISIDQINDRLFLFTDSIEIYNLKGVFQQKITQSSGTILDLKLFGNTIILVTSSTMVIFDRKTLVNRGSLQGSGGGKILKVMYIQEYNHVLAYTDIIRFAQVFIFNLDTLLQVSSLKSQFTQNDVTIVVDSIFDSQMNILTYLDQTGSVSVIDYTGTYQQINVLKIREFHTGVNPGPIGMRLCTEANLIMVFSKNRIYLSNYAQFSNSYKKYSLRSNNYFVEIDKINQVTQQKDLTFIFLGSLNSLYIYSQQRFLYFTHIISQDKIKDLTYVSNSFLVIAFSNKILIYEISSIINNLEIGIDNITPIQENSFQFNAFLCPNVFITQDFRIIHYDFSQQVIIKEIKISNYLRITAKLLIDSLQILILGFNDGSSIIYDLNLKKITTINLNLNASNNNDVHFIIKTENYIWIVSLNSQVVQVSISTMTETKRFDFISFMGSTPQILGVIAFDEVNQRIFVSFFREKIVRCLKLSDQSFIQSLSFPDAQYNRIEITPTQVIFYSTSQLNIHNRATLKFLTAIRRQNLQDEIISIYTFDDTYYCIISLYKFEIFKVDFNNGLTITLLDQIKVNSLKVMKIQLDDTQQSLRVIGVSKNQLFDQQYSLRYYQLQKSFNYKQCSLKIKDQTYMEMQKSVNLIKPLYNQLPTLLGLVELPNSSSNTFFTIYLSKEDLTEVNVGSSKDSQMTIAPYQGSNSFSPQLNEVLTQTNQLKISENTFMSYPKEEILIKNFNLVLQNNKKNISINPITKRIYLQNISISNQNLQDLQILISNNNSVIIFNLIFENLVINFSDQNLSFLKFENCTQVQIYNLVLKNVSVIGLNSLFLSIIGATKVSINSLKITDSNLGQLLQFINVSNLTLTNIIISECKTLIDSSIDTVFFIRVQGTQILKINEIEMKDNVNIKFLFSQNVVQKQLQTITLNTDQVQINQAQFISNTIDYSKRAPLILFQSTNVNLNQIEFTLNNGNIQFMNSQTVTLVHSTFKNNTNENGGALQLVNNKKQINIQNSIFQFNQAYGSGGAIYCKELTGIIQIDNLSIIQNNSALIGGGIRIYNINNDMRESEFQQLFSAIQLNNNAAILYGQQYATFLQKIEVTSIISDSSTSNKIQQFLFSNENKLTKDEQALYSGKLSIKEIRSGSELKISLLAMDSSGDFIRFSIEKLKKNEYPEEIQQELLSYYFKIESEDKKYVLLNGETLITSDQYNTLGQQFSFREVQISSYPQKKSSMLINYMINNKKSKPILVEIEFRSCLIGETIKLFSDNILSCQLCPEGSFSLIVPSLSTTQNSSSDKQTNTQMIEENSQCQKCPESAEKCEGYQIILKDGYWRSSQNSSEIIYCENNPENCQSQNQKSIEGCLIGSLGPLCEECDTFGRIWKKEYTRSFKGLYNCEECSSMTYQITFLAALSFVLIIYALMSTFIFMSSFMYTQTCYYLRKLSIFPISRSSIKDQSSFYLKILLNYLQLSSYLIYFKINILPQFVSDCLNILQSPTYKIIVSIDCIISKITTNRIDRIHTIQVIFLVLPLVYAIFLIFVLKVMEKLKKYSVKSSHIYTLLNFLFVLFQPSQITYFTQSLSCRQVGSKKYLEVDLLIECQNSEYEYFSIPYSITILIVWILAPIIIFYKLRKQKDNLNSCITKYKYGYYYSEFKCQFYYWEFIRQNLRISVVMVFTLMKENIYLVYLLIIFIFGLYIKSVLVFCPIQSKKLQKFEIMANQVIILNLILTSISITFPSNILETFIYSAHLLFIFYIITVIMAYKINSKHNLVGKIIRWILKKLLSELVFQKFIKKNIIHFITYKRWKMIKSGLPSIIGINALLKAQKAANSQSSAIKNSRQEELQTQIFSNIQDITRSAFNPTGKDEIIEYTQKNHNTYSKQNSLYINKDECPFNNLSDTHHDIHCKKPDNQEDMLMASSKISNISENIDIRENDIVTFQQSTTNHKRNSLPGQYNLHFICKSELDKKKKSNNYINDQLVNK